MIFLYLFIASLVILGIIAYFEHKRTGKNLLQIIKSSCSIDSVVFEHSLKKTHKRTESFKKYIYSIGHISSKKALVFSELQATKIKRAIRKRLQEESVQKEPSSHISHIKEK